MIDDACIVDLVEWENKCVEFYNRLWTWKASQKRTRMDC